MLKTTVNTERQTFSVDYAENPRGSTKSIDMRNLIKGSKGKDLLHLKYSNIFSEGIRKLTAISKGLFKNMKTSAPCIQTSSQLPSSATDVIDMGPGDMD